MAPSRFTRSPSSSPDVKRWPAVSSLRRRRRAPARSRDRREDHLPLRPVLRVGLHRPDRRAGGPYTVTLEQGWAKTIYSPTAPAAMSVRYPRPSSWRAWASPTTTRPTRRCSGDDGKGGTDIAVVELTNPADRPDGPSGDLRRQGAGELGGSTGLGLQEAPATCRTLAGELRRRLTCSSTTAPTTRSLAVMPMGTTKANSVRWAFATTTRSACPASPTVTPNPMAVRRQLLDTEVQHLDVRLHRVHLRQLHRRLSPATFSSARRGRRRRG